MFVFALVLAVLLVLGPPAVHSRFNSISFSSVTQCGSFNVHFSGGKLPAALPLTLTVVPFNSTPVSIEIPTFSWNSTTATGAVVTFLPLSVGAEFVASLDDAYGRPTGLVSDVIAVEPSTNTSCLPDPSTSSPARYTLPDASTYSQCANFDISYDPGVVDVPPTIRAFIPKNNSFPVNRTSIQAAGTATYTMDAPHGKQVVLMLSDDTGFHQATSLFVVGGDDSSSSDCLPILQAAPSPGDSNASTASPGGLSRAAVIAIAVVTSTVVGGIALAMAIWSCLHRRRQLRASADNLKWDPELWGDSMKKMNVSPYSGPATIEKRLPLTPVIQNPLPAALRTRHSDDLSQVARNPLYTASIRSSAYATSLRSLTLLQPGGQSAVNSAPMLPSLPTSPFVSGLKQPVGRSAPQSAHTSPARSTRSRNPTSVSSDDIEYMLEIGTVYSPATVSASLRTLEVVNAASDSRSNVQSGAFDLNLSHDHPSMQASVNERPSPRLRTPTPNPSYVRTSDGFVVTNTYDASNWVARSLPSSPDTRASQTQTLLSPASYRSPPQAHIPSSPMSAFSAASDPPYVVAGSRQP